MNLREILQDIAENNNQPKLISGDKEVNASDLLETLHPVKLKRKAHFQPGLYIAAINDAGYLGDVLFKVKAN